MMEIIIEEVQEKVKKVEKYFGIKVIYCCPRFFNKDKIQASIVECISPKERFPNNLIFGKVFIIGIVTSYCLIHTGYDLVGPEDRRHPLKYFVVE